ncbi:Riboflavin biosynthesis protein PYRR [Picochlorum sp. SENEW3]|nr:Riboflavin biosynthesis protein PYRR [Picochlorum sp. SENEW3]
MASVTYKTPVEPHLNCSIRSCTRNRRQKRQSCRDVMTHMVRSHLTERDVDVLVQTAELSLDSVTKTQPHPNAGCILTDTQGSIVGQGSLWAQGAEAPEVIAVKEAQGAAAGGTAYLNLETGDCHGDTAAIQALIHSGVKRCVVGMLHPLEHSRGKAVDALLSAGIHVDILQNTLSLSGLSQESIDRLDIIYSSNEALLHRAALGKPMGIIKYAMTLDGKIAASSGHSAWVSSQDSRGIVFRTRASCDAVIIGGQTVRRDNPRLTTRMEGGHQPVRIVMSRRLDLPMEADMWDTQVAPTIVATQKGAKKDMQRKLVSKGVEVVEFDFLTPEAVSEYCYQRGFLSCLWECGGVLAAPAVADNTIHKVIAFIAPKIIGGKGAPTPMGELGFVEMTQAIDILHPQWSTVGPDVMISGYLPISSGPKALADSLGIIQSQSSARYQPIESSKSATNQLWLSPQTTPSQVQQQQQLEFYKCWDKLGCLSNFSPHPIDMPDVTMDEPTLEAVRHALTTADAPIPHGRLWPSSEHYYQAQKFHGVDHKASRDIIEDIMRAPSPDEAAKIGRTAEASTPELLHPDWEARKLAVMHAALLRKFSCHKGPRDTLLGTLKTPHAALVESSPHDFFWGRGIDGTGSNHLGKLLMTIRDELSSQT